jgi:hypothetical protein
MCLLTQKPQNHRPLPHVPAAATPYPPILSGSLIYRLPEWIVLLLYWTSLSTISYKFHFTFICNATPSHQPCYQNDKLIITPLFSRTHLHFHENHSLIISIYMKCIFHLQLTQYFLSFAES